MTIEKKTIRSDIPGSHVFLNGNLGYAGSPADEIRRLVVTRDICLSGTIDACNYLVIEGVVEAQSFTARRMDILDTGFFRGAAEVQDCVIAGRFEGKLTVLGRLTVKPTGQIYGDIEYGTLEVEAGGRLEGRTSSLSAAAIDEPANEQEPLTALPPATVMMPAVDNVEPLFSEEEEQSFSGRKAAYRRAGQV